MNKIQKMIANTQRAFDSQNQRKFQDLQNVQNSQEK